MYAIIVTRLGDEKEDGRAEPRVLSTHRTLEAAQRKWVVHFKDDEIFHSTRAAGILGPNGLLNYHGERLVGGGAVGRIEVRMGVYRD